MVEDSATSCASWIYTPRENPPITGVKTTNFIFGITRNPRARKTDTRIMNWNVQLLCTIARILHILHIVYIYISFTPSSEPLRFYTSFTFTSPLHHRQNPWFYTSFTFTSTLHHRQNPSRFYTSFTFTSKSPLHHRQNASCTFYNIKILPRVGTCEFLTVVTIFSGAW